MKPKHAGRPDYVLVVGQGRSGTNWLLELLDLSPVTYCRNETNELESSPLADLPSPVASSSFEPGFGEAWDAAVASAAQRMGMRDVIGAHPKHYLSEAARRTIGSMLLSRSRVRWALSAVVPGLRGPEWPVPKWYASRIRLREALGVLKLNQVPGWAEWVLRNREDARVVHIVRHPGGFLNSWRNRCLLANGDHKAMVIANQERLVNIAAMSEYWSDLFGDIRSMSVEESELWYWRYANEVIYREGKDRSSYQLVVYEQLVEEPVPIVRELYQRCSLSWSDATESAVLESTSGSRNIADAWQEKLPEGLVPMVHRVAGASVMAGWWSGLGG